MKRHIAPVHPLAPGVMHLFCRLCKKKKKPQKRTLRPEVFSVEHKYI